MNTKLIFGMSAICSAGLFWACGEGDIVKADQNDRLAKFAGVNKVKEMTEQEIKEITYGIVPESSSEEIIIFSSANNNSSGYNIWENMSSSSSFKIIQPKSSSSLPPLSFYQPDVSSSSQPLVYDGKGYCYPTVNGEEVASINKGESVVWKYNPGMDAPTNVILAARKANYNWAFVGGAPSLTTDVKSGMQESSAITYTASGTATASVTASIVTEKIDCKPLEIRGAPVSGCKCAPVAKEVDLNGGTEVLGTWNVSGCMSTDMNFTYQWEDGITSDGSSMGSFLFTKKNIIKAPKVRAVNADNGAQDVTCGEIKSIDGENPDYVIKFVKDNEVPQTKISVKNKGCIYVKGAWYNDGYTPSVKMVCGIRLAAGAAPGLTLSLSYNGKSSLPASGQYNVDGVSIALGTLPKGEINIENVCVEFTGEALGGTAECGLQTGN